MFKEPNMTINLYLFRVIVLGIVMDTLPVTLNTTIKSEQPTESNCFLYIEVTFYDR